MNRQSHLLVKQLDQKIEPFYQPAQVTIPDRGWIKAIRSTLNMTMSQLGKRLKITRQGVKSMEENEVKGAISINSLKEFASVMDLKLVYGFVAMDGSLENLIDRKTLEIAEKIVERTNHNMKLEDQSIGDDKVKQSIKELAIELKRELNKSLWD